MSGAGKGFMDRRAFMSRASAVAGASVAGIPLLNSPVPLLPLDDVFAPVLPNLNMTYENFDHTVACKVWWALRDLHLPRAEFVAERRRNNVDNGLPAMHWPKTVDSLDEGQAHLKAACDVLAITQARLVAVLPSIQATDDTSA